MIQPFLLLDTITNEKTVKFLQLDIFTDIPDLQVSIILVRIPCRDQSYLKDKDIVYTVCGISHGATLLVVAQLHRCLPPSS